MTQTEKSTDEMIREIHAWLQEIMPFARQAMRLMDKRQQLLGMVTGRAKRGNKEL